MWLFFANVCSSKKTDSLSLSLSISVTRFGKNCQYGNILQVFGKFFTVKFVFGKMLSLLWQICNCVGLIFIVGNGQILKDNLTVWSHCSLSKEVAEKETLFRQDKCFCKKNKGGGGVALTMPKWNDKQYNDNDNDNLWNHLSRESESSIQTDFGLPMSVGLFIVYSHSDSVSD